jgi:hypothetical protein
MLAKLHVTRPLSLDSGVWRRPMAVQGEQSIHLTFMGMLTQRCHSHIRGCVGACGTQPTGVVEWGVNLASEAAAFPAAEELAKQRRAGGGIGYVGDAVSWEPPSLIAVNERGVVK